jgi:hypothetical protein
MSQSPAPHSQPYECRILDRDLKVVRTTTFHSPDAAQAIEIAADLVRQQGIGAALAGFEVWKDNNRLLVRLEPQEAGSPEGLWLSAPRPQAD